jgi:hypothetical protein
MHTTAKNLRSREWIVARRKNRLKYSAKGLLTFLRPQPILLIHMGTKRRKRKHL